MSLRAMTRNIRRHAGYRHSKDDYAIDVAPVERTTVRELLARKRPEAAVVLADPSEVNSFGPTVDLLSLPEPLARFTLGDDVYEQVIDSIPLYPKGSALKVTAIDGSTKIVTFSTRTKGIQIGD